MNEHFINIKVDREERPDVDAVYMTACQLISGDGCGWPLNAIAMPDGSPFFAGTYFTPKRWQQVLEYFIKSYEESPGELLANAQKLKEGIFSVDELPSFDADRPFSMDQLDLMGNNFMNALDTLWGGRQGSPKFPMPNGLEFLINYGTLGEESMAIDQLHLSLERMANGGIYDHLGGGFARYSTDEKWKVPHFEKMLYDNAQLIHIYAKAYRQDPNPLYKEVVEESIAFCNRELKGEAPLYYSSLDADSEGVEGKFYVWTEEELEELISSKEDLALFKLYYQIGKEAQWEEANILYPQQSISQFVKDNQLDFKSTQEAIARVEKRLFDQRANRVRPALDDKSLCSWNALMIEGLIEAYKSFGKEEYLLQAQQTATFIFEKMYTEEGRLWRNYKGGKVSINGFLDDYAQLANACLHLYEVDFDLSWLERCEQLVNYAITHFYDSETGLFYYTSNEDQQLVVRQKETTDKVISSSNSVMARSLARLGHLKENEEYISMSSKMLNIIMLDGRLYDQANFYSNWGNLLSENTSDQLDVVIVGPEYAEKRKEIAQAFLPNVYLMGSEKESNLPLIKGKYLEDETLIYVCKNKVCKFPVSDTQAALELIEGERSLP